jgi:hypothetical protein
MYRALDCANWHKISQSSQYGCIASSLNSFEPASALGSIFDYLRRAPSAMTPFCTSAATAARSPVWQPWISTQQDLTIRWATNLTRGRSQASTRCGNAERNSLEVVMGCRIRAFPSIPLDIIHKLISNLGQRYRVRARGARRTTNTKNSLPF